MRKVQQVVIGHTRRSRTERADVLNSGTIYDHALYNRSSWVDGVDSIDARRAAKRIGLRDDEPAPCI